MDPAPPPPPTPRRLLVISHGFPPYYGGAEHAAGYLARAAAASGRWTVEVLTSDIGGRLPARESWHGCDVLRVRTRKRAWARHTAPELLDFLRAATACRAVSPPDWILAHFSLPAGGVARTFARRFGAPYAVVLQGSDVPGYQNRRFGPLYALVRPWLRRVWRDAAAVFAVSESLRDLARRAWPGGRVEVIPNGVDPALFQPLENRAARTSNPWKTAVATAQLIERKGLQYLLDALASLPPELRGRWRLKLCGAGPYEAALRRRARERGLADQVEFAGLVAHAALPELYRAADVFALPSLQEGLPLALVEALACGLPAVATTVGGIPTVLRDGENGLLVPPADAPALARALTRLLTEEPLLDRLAAAARASVAPWSWARLWERYEARMPGPGVASSGRSAVSGPA